MTILHSFEVVEFFLKWIKHGKDGMIFQKRMYLGGFLVLQMLKACCCL